jgi:hypothetical protein
MLLGFFVNFKLGMTLLLSSKRKELGGEPVNRVVICRMWGLPKMYLLFHFVFFTAQVCMFVTGWQAILPSPSCMHSPEGTTTRVDCLLVMAECTGSLHLCGNAQLPLRGSSSLNESTSS